MHAFLFYLILLTTEPLKMVNISVANPGQMLVSTPDVTSKPVGSMPRGSGIEWSQLPAKYHRKPLSQEEIEFIEVSHYFLLLTM